MTRIALCGGTYSNPYALRAFVADARARGAERLWCLGDFGAYGAEPEAIRPLLAQHGVECIAGNYEVAIGSGQEDCGCGYADDADNAFAQIAYDYTFRHTSAEFAAWMRTLDTEHRETAGDVDLHLVHGSPLALNDFWWESLDDDAHRLRVDASGADVVCCTHSGLPWTRRVERSDGGETLVVNVGVLGRPANDGSQHVWYALLDLDGGTASAELVALDYDWAAQAASIRAAGLPEAFAEAVESGWWTTCLEIVPPLERSRGRYQLYKSALPDFSGAEVSWGGAPPVPDDDRPVLPLFGSALFPPRLWIYTNFDCNLACGYCSVASSPRARRRRLGLARFTELVDEAVELGFTEVYVTGGEPFLERDVVEMLLHATERLDVVCLTNAMLYQGWRREQLERLAGRPRLTLQTSLDGTEAAHDTQRGAGSWARALGGVDVARGLGLPVRVGMTETELNTGQEDLLRAVLAGHGVDGDQVAARPLVARGHSGAGLSIGEGNTVPELTVTADGWHWHPAGADVGTSPDMLLGGPELTMAEARRRVVERFLRWRQRDGSLPLIYQCAV